MEPPVSLPSAPLTSRAATATALPPLEPPGTRLGSHGFLAAPKALFWLDEPMANSSMFVLPINTASASRRRATTVASNGARQPRLASGGAASGALRVRIREPQGVGASVVHSASFKAIGTPAKAA